MRRPLLIPCLAYMLGILFAEFFTGPLATLVIFAVMLLPLAWIFRGSFLFNPAVLTLLFLLGSVNHVLTIEPPSGDISRLAEGRGVYYRVVGWVDSPVRVTAHGQSKKQTFLMQVRTVYVDGRARSMRGRIQCTAMGSPEEINFGDLIRVWGEWRAPDGAKNPGEFDYRAYMAREGIGRRMTVIGKKSVRVLAPRAVNPARRFTEDIRQALGETFNRLFQGDHAALLSALIVGDRKNLSFEINEAFTRTGTVHILSISGLHIALTAGFGYALFRFLGFPQRVNAFVAVVLMLLYTPLAGFQIPVLRSTLMGIVFYTSIFLRENRDGLNNLALAALSLLIMNTRWLFSVSFQLSFLCVLSMMLWSGDLERRLTFIPWLYLRRGIAVSLAVMAGAQALITYYFSTLTPISLLANLVVVPMTTAIIVGGFLTLAFSHVPLLSTFSAACVSKIITATLWVNEGLAHIPFGHWHVPKPSLAIVLGYYVLLTLVWVSRRFWRLRYGWIIGGLALSTVTAFAMSCQPNPAASITMLEVKQTGIFLIRTPDAKYILVNTGHREKPDVARWTLIPFLKSRGIQMLDALLITDRGKRFGGAASTIARVFDVQRTFLADALPGRLGYAEANKGRRFIYSKSNKTRRRENEWTLETIRTKTGKAALAGTWAGKSFMLVPSLDRALLETLVRQKKSIDILFLHIGSRPITEEERRWIAALKPAHLIFSGDPKSFKGGTKAEIVSTREHGATTVSWTSASDIRVETFLRT